MTWTDYRLGPSAWAAAYLCMNLPTAPIGIFGCLLRHVHQAFWCAVIHAAALSPIYAIRYLSERQRPPRILQQLAPLAGYLWSEIACSGVARWVQLFVIHASLSPSLAGPSFALDRSAQSPYSVLTQGILHLCIVQIVHDITVFLRALQTAVQSEAEEAMTGADLQLDGPVDYATATFETLNCVFLAGQSLVYACLAHLFTTTALYLERMAAGTFVTALSNAHDTLAGWRYCLFAAWAFVILMAIVMHVCAAHHPAVEQLYPLIGEVRGVAPPPPPQPPQQHDPRPRPPVAETDIPLEMLRRLGLRLAWVGRWSFPEAAALWPEGERRRFYAAALTGVPPSVLAASWGHAPLRRRHVDLWRRAGLTTDFLFVGDETTAAAAPAAAAPGLLGLVAPPRVVIGCLLFLGRAAATLVCGLEAVFSVCVVLGGIAVVVTR